MKIKNYTHYSSEQLLQDEFFLKSQLHPTEETIRFWEELMQQNDSFAKEYRDAKTILKSIPYRQRSLSNDDINILWDQIEKTNKLHRIKRRENYFIISAAASVLLLFTLGSIYYFNRATKNTISSIEMVAKPKTASNNIQLILGDKKEMDIQDEMSELQYNKKGELSINSKLINTEDPSNANEKTKNPVYNQLIVPSAKRSFLELSDGTKIWVNANTRVVYPVAFDGDKREIYVDGEIYLEVYHDEQKPFVVKTKKMNVNVLGTKFNVFAREENTEASVVLVSGKVNVKTGNSPLTVLRPKERLVCEGGKIGVEMVNVEDYISWKDGFYSFDDTHFSVVLEKLSNYYGKKIIFDQKVAELRCSGTLNLKDDIYEILQGLECSVPVAFVYDSESIKVIVKP